MKFPKSRFEAIANEYLSQLSDLTDFFVCLRHEYLLLCVEVSGDFYFCYIVTLYVLPSLTADLAETDLQIAAQGFHRPLRHRA